MVIYDWGYIQKNKSPRISFTFSKAFARGLGVCAFGILGIRDPMRNAIGISPTKTLVEVTTFGADIDGHRQSCWKLKT